MTKVKPDAIAVQIVSTYQNDFPPPRFWSIPTALDLIKGFGVLALSIAAMTLAASVGYEVGGTNLSVIMTLAVASVPFYYLTPNSNPLGAKIKQL